jgi:multidrug resistance protein, MATE family
MRQTFNYRQKAREFFIVLLPIFIAQLAIMSTGFFDTIMAGHVSEQDLAGVAVGTNLFFPFFGSSLGIIAGLTPVIANHYGAGRREQIVFVVRQGFYWALGLGVLFILLGYIGVPLLLPHLGLEPRVAYVTTWYLAAMACGVIPIFLAGVLRNFIDALGFTRITMYITLCIVPVNIFTNYLFIFGKAGLPALGGIGAGVGTATAFCISLLLNILVVSLVKPFREYHILGQFIPPLAGEWKRQLSIGIPIGSTMFCEQSIFGAVGLFMTAYGTEIVAAHQAAMNFTTMVYMIPLSVSMTLTILIGYELGAGRLTDAKKYRRMGWFLSMFFSICLALLLVNFRAGIAALYTNDSSVEKFIAVFLIYAIIMQVADGIDAPLQGSLRGYRDVKVTFFLAVLSYWGIGLPLGWMLATYFGFGPYGYWMGLISGLVAGALFLSARLRIVEGRYMQRENVLDVQKKKSMTKN